MQVLEYMKRYGHEQLCVYSDPDANLRAFIAIHDTTLGPACGGVRIWPHQTEDDAIVDVLRLARAMTYKWAVAGLAMGGGKALIMANPHTDKTEVMFHAFGRFVETLKGRYITTEDVGCISRDLEWVSKETKHVAGLPLSQGGSGDPSVMTGLGVYQGMRACARQTWGSDSLFGRTVALQGFGHVASYLAEHLLKDGAQLIVTDINKEALDRAQRLEGVTVVAPENIYDTHCDIFSPNALGGILNKDTIPLLKCEVICGGANNQLWGEQDAKRIEARGILYAPDYVVNAGGIINISVEMQGSYEPERAREKTLHIYDTLEEVIIVARQRGITTAEAADHIAEKRLRGVRKTIHHPS
jgi:leucine dehydrogenase